MKITVFGATGGTGIQVVRHALRTGHEVTAVVRDRSRLQVPDQDVLRVVTAELTEHAALVSAVEGADAVVSALGPRGRGPSRVCRDGAAAIIAAMREAGTGRLVAVSASGLSGDGDALPVRLLVKPILGLVLREAFDDMRAMEHVVRDSDRDWTIVRPPQLTANPPSGEVRTRLDGNVRGGFRITRADLGEYLVRAASDDLLIGQTVSVAGG
jgi:putative NADH-flavin reductase